MPDPPVRAARGGRRAADWLRRAAVILTAFALYALLLDAAIETWQSLSPVRWYVAVPVAVYLSFTTWLVGQHSSHRPSLETGIQLSLLLFLGVVAATLMQPGGLTDGLRVLSLPTQGVLTATAIGLVVWALWSLVIGSPLTRGPRVIAVAAACYGVFGLADGLVKQLTFVRLLHGGGEWSRLPYFLQGAFVGALFVVPLAFMIEVGAALARVKVRGRMARILALGLGSAIAYLAFTG